MVSFGGESLEIMFWLLGNIDAWYRLMVTLCNRLLLGVAYTECWLYRGCSCMKVDEWLQWVLSDFFGNFDCGLELVLLMMVVAVAWFIILFLPQFQADRFSNVSIYFGGKKVMMDGYIMWGVGEVGYLVVISFFIDVIWRGKKLVSLCCLSCLIFRRGDRTTFFAIAIHFANEFVFNSENSIISISNHLDCSGEISLACRWRVPTSWTMSWCSWLYLLLAFGTTSWIRLQ